MKPTPALLFLGIFGLLTLPTLAVTISDNFNDGDAAGWTPLSSLSIFGAGGVYSFPGGGYQILAPASPNPGSLGPARAGSLRTDISHTQFETQVDVTDWDATKPNMVVGLLARVSTPGLSTTNGYALIYNASGNLSIVRITAEASAATIASLNLSVPLTTASDYRLHFAGNGDVLTGEIYDLSAPSVALASISGSDAIYNSGVGGMFVYDGSSGGSLSASATFDNYSLSNVPEPATVLNGFLGLAALTARRRRS